MRRSLNTLAYPSLLVAWLIVVVGVYGAPSQYDFVHVFIIPLDLPKPGIFAHVVPGQYVLDLFLAMVGALVFSAACLALGLLVVRFRAGADGSLLETGPSAFLVGEIIFSIVFLSCIVLYRLNSLIVAAVFAAALLLGAKRLVAFARALPRPRIPSGFTAVESLILILAIAVMALTAMYSSAILGYDSVVQYFTQPKLLAMLQTVAITYFRDSFLVSSLHSEILYTAMMQTFGDQAARLLSWVNGLMLLPLGLGVAKLVGLTRRARLWFVCLMLTSTAYVDLLGDGKVELISTAFVLAAVYWLLRSFASPSKSAFGWFGLFAGFAILARPYNALLIPLFAAAFYTIQIMQKKREGAVSLHPYLVNGLWVLPPLILLGSFHLLQNWLWLGNPIAPILDSRQVTADVWQWQLDPKLLNFYRMLYPFVVTFDNSPQSLGNVSPFVIGFLPFLLFPKVRATLREHRQLLSLTLAGLITLVGWLVAYFTVVEIRYVLFLWVLFFLFTGQVIDIAVSVLRLRATLLLRPLMIFALAYMGIRSSIIALGSYSPVDRSGRAHCYFLDLCNFTEPLNNSAAPGERVFVVNAYRYYLRPDLFACSSLADEYGKLQQLAQNGSPEFWSELYRRGFRYVTYEANFATFHAHFGTLPPITSTPPWLHVSLIHSNTASLFGNQMVYQIQATASPFQPQTTCKQDASGVWHVLVSSPGE